MKPCIKCRAVKAIEQFYVHRSMRDGHSNKCIACTRAYAVVNRDKNVERARAYDRLRGKTEARKKHKRLATASMRQRGNYMLAWNAVRRAVRSGKLQRPDKCQRCLEPCKPNGHHDDHSKPLEVMWLCCVCHSQRHKELARRA